MKNIKEMTLKELDEQLANLDKLPIRECIRIKNEMIKELSKDIPFKIKLDDCNVCIL